MAAASAFAQSTVGIKGTFDPSLANQVTTYGKDGGGGETRATTGLINNAQGTSQVTFFGTEDLGGGLKANFLLENDFNATTDAKSNWGNATNGGETFVGLSGSYGAIQLGAPNTPSLDVSGRTPFGTKIGSGFGSTQGVGNVQGLGHVRENNSAVYTSPTVAGFTAKIGVAAKTIDAAAANVQSNGTAVARAASKEDVSVTYANGPLKAVVANYKQEGVYKQTHGYVAYTLGSLTATYGFGSDDRLAAQAKADGSATAAGKVGLSAGKSSNSNVALAYVMGQTTLMANVGKNNDKTADNLDQKISAFGAKYDLSPRTSLYARYVKLTTDNTGGLSSKNATYLIANQKTTLVGIQHNF